MKNENFQVINYIRDMIIDIDNELSNFPKKDIELKNRIRVNCYDMLELAYEANISDNIENKRKLINQMLAKVKVIDFLLGLSNDKMLITNKKYIKLGLRIGDITKYTIGWLKNIGHC